jgi:hypothetical protein
MDDDALLGKLRKMPADLIGQFHQREDTRNTAAALIDLESDDILRLNVIDLLEKLEAH